ncbi:alpha-1,4-glucan synthase Ags1 [Schizosaccharomyces japonicus yFS275]|uniref:alpha-1,3-glucan synthase n=1 Tax=Schizosaccharomyces japonicus (strain yFS275 / FY16936) TaxID=402676 RepID=B6K1I6_SCHJY|nr:alpha-1,4-glucan synthase Ags1 [Schizosaccharomyces japonicus yFS275]EEB07807.1 alpha-1,4-glucan synthase Ags1 [Schizosaccharomyces japonicus yFS275]
MHGLLGVWTWKGVFITVLGFVVFLCVSAAPYMEDMVKWNLNTNKTATEVLDYSGEWSNHQFTASPSNWRMNMITVILDRWYDGDPTNNDINGTYYEYDIRETSLRNGGDIIGLKKSLDYIQGMGVGTIYIAGTPFINMPWGADQYSPLDLTILDPHLGTIDDWRDTIEEIHSRGMYLIVDMTVATLGDLVGLTGYLNGAVDFSLNEHDAQWKNVSRQYLDFKYHNVWNKSCELPRFWGDDGHPVQILWKGCYVSDIDQYGDTEAFGSYPDWRRQLSKFASVQDRLREWNPDVNKKLRHLSCLLISMLDVDGFRIDKATQMTVDFLTDWSMSVRECAKKYNKNNFFIPGEVTGSSSYGAIYYGRGRQPDNRPPNTTVAFSLQSSDSDYFLRDETYNNIDASAFHYSVYRGLTRFLGMDSAMEISYDVSNQMPQAWNGIQINEDFINPNTGKLDPRHMYGVTNHDLFRWGSIQNGTERLMLGTVITSLMFPGIPLLYYGDEQGLYILDNTAGNYLYGRQPMNSAWAWYLHGCYGLNATQYPSIDLTPAKNGCHDEWNSYDHFDVASEYRNAYMNIHQIRNKYVALLHGYRFDLIRNWTEDVYFPNSQPTPTVMGLYSVIRGAMSGIQNLTEYAADGVSTSPVWAIYSNRNNTVTWSYDCDSSNAILGPWAPGKVVKNLIYPYETYTLQNSANGSWGCLSSIELPAYGFKLFVPESSFVGYDPIITKVTPQHDARIQYTNNSFTYTIEFSQPMMCDDITKALSFSSSTIPKNITVTLDESSVTCVNYTSTESVSMLGQVPGVFSWSGKLQNVYEGIHEVTLKPVSNAWNNGSVNSTNHFLFRVGSTLNPMVFMSANYSDTLIYVEDSKYYINHTAAGAAKFRYSSDFARTWSPWENYTGEPTQYTPSNWTGTKKQMWKGQHIQVQYWSDIAASANHMQEGDHGYQYRRTVPNMFLMGPFNEWGYDSGVSNKFTQVDDDTWEVNFVSSTYPAIIQFNAWGVNSDKEPDKTKIYGSQGNTSALMRTAPSDLSANEVIIYYDPGDHYLAYKVKFYDHMMRYELVPVGSWTVSIVIYILCIVIPPISAIIVSMTFKGSFYKVKFNKHGTSTGHHFFPLKPISGFKNMLKKSHSSTPFNPANGAVAGTAKRKCVLIATLEYDISDWQIKIKIGGLGVMAQLMGKNLKHQDLVWVVPCVGDIAYPEAEEAAPIEVKIIDQTYTINVYHHYVDNIKYVLLDAPVFRRQNTKEPYPARMDDLGSAIFYSAWNQCIAEVIRRNPIDIYHINDYHGALAPCYLLPDVIPCALSLHNAEFQGLWPLRTPEEKEEVCAVYNIPQRVCSKYVQFGNVFNLLHAAVSYIRIHQKGFGVVGVSNKYGKRSWARYPIFWGLKKIGKLPNPDPTDTDDVGADASKSKVTVDPDFERQKLVDKKMAQEWAGLEVDESYDLLVFVGRWSLQKGIDLIADIAPSLLENYKVQLLCVGPVIDLYGKFAAEKLSVLMEHYPTRVFSRPQFTQLPPYIFSGADFALIPSRDEPFGLVAVEFGRKGALGIGARVGGLGQMPGWWFTVESTATQHLLRQFETACQQALSSSQNTRALLRARSLKQRFPVSEWIAKLEALTEGCIKASIKCRKSGKSRSSFYSLTHESVSRSSEGLHTINEPNSSATSVSSTVAPTDSAQHLFSSFTPAADSSETNVSDIEKLSRSLSLGRRTGPAHQSDEPAVEGLDAIREENFEDIEEPDIWNADAIRDKIASHYRDSQTPSEFSQDSADFEFDPQKPYFYDDLLDDETVIRNAPSFRPQVGNFDGEHGLGATVSQDDSTEGSKGSDVHLPPPSPPFAKSPSGGGNPYMYGNLHTESSLSLASVMTGKEKKDFALTKVEQTFTDSDGHALQKFSEKLKELNPKNSKDDLCIELFLLKSEKHFYEARRVQKLGLQKPSKPHFNETSVHPVEEESDSNSSGLSYSQLSQSPNDSMDFVDTDTYQPVTGIKKFMQRKILGWPIYSIIVALGQILAATSYQLTLFSGSYGLETSQLYAVCGFFIVASLFWWFGFSKYPSRHCLSLPFVFYAIAFFMIGLPAFNGVYKGRYWISCVAAWIYSIGSSSGSLFFALNFGDEGHVETRTWVFRACLVQGTQQVWSAAIWYWGAYLSKANTSLTANYKISPVIPAITWPLACLSVLFFFMLRNGLPDYYYQLPGKIPAFYTALLRRKLVIWFCIAVFLQNFWLSTLNGRSWTYLWAISEIPQWQIFILVVVFYIIIWAALLALLGWVSGTHSWLICVFGVGLGAPRWLQIFWGTSNIGLYLPWAGDAGPYLGRCLWLWLGVLDAIQSVGIGMILLQTLTRKHVASALMTGQIIGAVATIIGRAGAPNRVGPANVFLDFTGWNPGDGAHVLASAPFWICLFCQLAICAGFLLFFRRENLSRP